jgi:hypothetical protein
MTFNFRERPSSRSGTTSPPSVTLKYVATGSSDDLFVRNYAISASPQIYATSQGVLYRQDIKVSAESADTYYIDVPYGPKEKETGSFTLSFDTQGGTIHISNSLETIQSYPIGAAPDFKQAIGVNGDEVAGCDVVTPALKLTLAYKHPTGVISLPRIKVLALATGTVNSDTFLTFPPGSVLFLGCSGSEGTASETEVTYHFACSENAESLTIGALTNVRKKGHDYLWVAFKDDIDGGRPVKVPQYVYTERVYKFASLSGILGFGG